MTYEQALAKQLAERGVKQPKLWRPSSPLTGKCLWGRPDVYGDQVFYMAGTRIPNPNGQGGTIWMGYVTVAIHENGQITGDIYNATVALLPEAAMGNPVAANDGWP